MFNPLGACGMKLKDLDVRNAQPRERAYKLADGFGLYLEVTPSGGKLWRLKYRFLGAEKRLALGAYPLVSLKDARAKRDDAKRLLADGQDPGAVRQAEKARSLELAADSFETIAKEWAQRHMADKAQSHSVKVMRRLEEYVFPYIGATPIANLTAPQVLALARRLEARNALETARRVVQTIGQVCRFAVATGRAQSDPTPALRGALRTATVKHMAAPADDPQAVGAILRSLDAFKGGPIVAPAIKLLPYLFCRPGELRAMRWEQIDLDQAQWRYMVSKTKTDHLVPLSRQAVAILQDLHPLTGHLPGGWVFPGARSPMRPMSDAAINAAYRRLGIDTQNELTGHGWRAVARTILHERLNYDPAVIEHQLAHAVPDALGTSYNRTKFLDKRTAMMQAWADYLDRLKTGAEVVPLRRAAR